MARNLSDSDVHIIVGIIDGWRGKLTYKLLLDSVEKRLFHRYSRQALYAHTRIRNAMELRKQSLKGRDLETPVKSIELQKALERINRLEAENTRLNAENEALLSQFLRWSYNASSKSLSLEFLNKPLPAIDRRPTNEKPNE